MTEEPWGKYGINSTLSYLIALSYLVANTNNPAIYHIRRMGTL